MKTRMQTFFEMRPEEADESLLGVGGGGGGGGEFAAPPGREAILGAGIPTPDPALGGAEGGGGGALNLGGVNDAAACLKAPKVEGEDELEGEVVVVVVVDG